MNKDLDLEQEMLKQRILSKNNTFKTAFKTTLGFYSAQVLVQLFGFSVLGLFAFIVYEVLKSLK